MLSYTDFMANEDMLAEKAITIGGKMYPKFNQVVIMAGGAGSGKGFIQDNLLAIEGLTFDVDALKQLVLKSNKIAKAIKTKTGYDVSNFDLKNADHVSTLHDLVGSTLVKSNESAKFKSIITADANRKPNLIFDVTLNGLRKLESITRNVQKLGYKKENISIVWVVNDVNVALQQNSERSRKVPEEILIDTHEGASATMLKITKMGESLKKYMDGDIYLAFNKRGVDSLVKSSGMGGKFVKDANYVQIKKKGKPVKKPEELSKEILNKIKDYTPKSDNW